MLSTAIAMKLLEMRRNDLLEVLETAAAATERVYSGQALVLEGTRRQASAIAALFRKHATKQQAAAALYQSWLQATRELRAELRADIIPTMFALRQTVGSMFGETAAEFREFGFRPRKPRTQNAESKRAAVVKAAATRKARGTMGKRQRRAVKGKVP